MRKLRLVDNNNVNYEERLGDNNNPNIYGEGIKVCNYLVINAII